MTNKAPESPLQPQIWEVWHARFNYSEGKGYKFRPVIIVGIRPSGNLVMMVTSVTNKLHLEHDYLLKNWKAAGLDKPSIARADRIAEIPPDYLGTAQRIGKLTEEDIRELTFILRNIS
jgi:hypothetical protein